MSGKKLTIRSVASLPSGRYSDGQGTGLLLRVLESGRRNWLQRLMIRGRRREIGLGGFPAISLAEAREIALANKRIATTGGDPLAEKRKAQNDALKQIAFEEATIRCRDELAPTWKGKKEAAAFLSSLRTHAFPFFGDVDVAEISSADIRRAVLKCRGNVPNMAMKVQHRILAVFKWAVAEGLCEVNPATADALALPKMERKTTKNRSLPYSEVRLAIATVNMSGAWQVTKLALQFTILTGARSGEVRGATWSEIDLSVKVWVIPASRMKMGREHRVPLSHAAINVLMEAQSLRDNSGLLFPSLNGKQLSDMTLSKLLRQLGIASTVHGFRASFRTWAQECTDVSHEVCEAALAHVTSDKTH